MIDEKYERGTTSEESLFVNADTRYGRVTVFSNDSGAVTQSLLKYGEWAENELRLLHAVSHEGDHVLDVGAYIGTHTLAFSRFVGPSGRVIAIEPQAPTFRLLKANVEANKLQNVELIQAVASCEAGAVVIPSIEVDKPDSFGSASLVRLFACENGAEAEPSELLHVTETRAVTIDGLALARCALIKIDAEGMEDLVLRGAVETLDRCKPIVYAECNSIDKGMGTFRSLRAANYKVKAHIVDAFNPDNFYGNAENIFDTGREVALVGLPPRGANRLEDYRLGRSELLLDVETADDIALALMNKPQYAPEVLWKGQAANTGGGRCLAEADAFRLEAESGRRDVAYLRDRIESESRRRLLDAAQVQEATEKQLAVLRDRIESESQRRILEVAQVQAAADKQLAASERELASTRQELERLRRAIENERRQTAATHVRLSRTEQALEAKVDACMRQIANLHSANKQLRTANDNLVCRESDSAAALAAVHASTSWRISAPARALIVRIRRFYIACSNIFRLR